MEHRNSRKIVNYLTVGYCIYALIYIWKTSFVIDGERFFVLLDDAMISMRYAKNFALGHGLVWNPGETPIEGYTNPLWTILMSFFHLFGLPLSKNSLVIQLLCIVFGVFTLRLTWLIVKEIEVKKTESEESSHLILLAQICATFLTAFYLPLITFSLQGMEVAILTPIICYSALLGIRYLRNPASPLSSPIVWVFLLLTISVFIRMDMVVPLIAFGAFLAIAVFTSNTDGTSWSKRKIVWQIILFTSLLAISSVGIQTAFRYWYYGDPLPNTYYLKMAAIPLITRLSKGIFVAANFFVKTGIIIILAPIVYIFLKPRKEYFFLFALITAQVAYSISYLMWQWYFAYFSL
ncbi:MAG: hypothetical protein HYZ54_05230 [Ignavibacteriae bacterium]|nr:hypothetical protein [Ignavibacteriota bacterium]